MSHLSGAGPARQKEADALRARTLNHQSRSTMALALESGASLLLPTVDENPQVRIDTVHLMQRNGVSIPAAELPPTTEVLDWADQNNQVLPDDSCFQTVVPIFSSLDGQTPALRCASPIRGIVISVSQCWILSATCAMSMAISRLSGFAD